jgi:hypothetical protein
MRFLLLIAIGSSLSCALLKQGPTPPPAVVVEEEDEEAGVDGIQQLLRDFRRNLASKGFEEATRLVVRAEKSVKRASDVTRSHPDFEDVVEEVQRSRERLDKAVEEDRIARREAAIDELIRRAEVALKQATTLVAELGARVPTKDDVGTLAELTAALATIRTDGGPFLDQLRYKEHAAERDKKHTTLEQRLAQARWQIEASTRVAKHIEEAWGAVSGIKEATDAAARVAAFQKAGTEFQNCAAAIADLATAPEYQDALLCESRLGLLSLAETRAACVDRAAKARREGLKLEWHHRVLDVVEAVAEPVQAVRDAQSATEILEAAEEALTALATCSAEAAKVARHAGAEPGKLFDTVFGKVTLARLEAACAAEKTRLERERPSLTWESEVEELGARLGETKNLIEETDRATEPAARVKGWQTIIGGLNECSERARAVARERIADRAFAVVTPYGKLTVAAIDQECGKLLGTAKKRLQEASAELELSKFLATCRGDEIAVAKREGIPTRIQNVDGGRFFIYEVTAGGKVKSSKRMSFDTEGKRVDFRLRWLNQVSNVVSELNRAIQAVSGAPTGAAALKATEEAIPILDLCTESLQGNDRNPGYDGTAVFNTVLGKVPAAKLGEACTAEKVRRAASMVGLKWRVRFEALRDRVADSQTERERAKAASSGADRASRLGVAVGGYTECVERADALAKEVGADRNLKIATPFGSQNLKAMASSCQAQLKAAQAELVKAVQEKALEEFVKTCRGDEVEVAKRQGIPTRIEERQGGRIFVYESAGKGKRKQENRFAFDSAGKRTDVNALKPK